MANVILSTDLAREFADGETEFEIDADNIRAVVKALDARFPGIRKALGPGTAVAIDGQIHREFFLEPVGPNSEVCFFPAVEGG
ncbi:MAG: MoaD/ThiS family protein [Alphaproteobacteria bacterium]